MEKTILIGAITSKENERDVEEYLKANMNIPVFHDDQHGTAIVVLAGLINAVEI